MARTVAVSGLPTVKDSFFAGRVSRAPEASPLGGQRCYPPDGYAASEPHTADGAAACLIHRSPHKILPDPGENQRNP